MPALLFALKYWRVIAAVVTVVGLLGGAWGYVEKVKHDAYVAGHDAGYSEADAKCQKEKAAQETANARVMADATKALDDLQKKIELKDIQLDDYLKALGFAADAAPGSTDACLDVSGVRRLGAIQ